VKTLSEYGINDRHLAELAEEVGLSLFDPSKLSV
jgi:hypothetical protein